MLPCLTTTIPNNEKVVKNSCACLFLVQFVSWRKNCGREKLIRKKSLSQSSPLWFIMYAIRSSLIMNTSSVANFLVVITSFDVKILLEFSQTVSLSSDVYLVTLLSHLVFICLSNQNPDVLFAVRSSVNKEFRELSVTKHWLYLT